jgi:surfactin synthase thioesterase subunit
VTNGNYHNLVFPGDHFFIMQGNDRQDEGVAMEIIRTLLRKLHIYV